MTTSLLAGVCVPLPRLLPPFFQSSDPEGFLSLRDAGRFGTVRLDGEEVGVSRKVPEAGDG